MKKFVKLFEGFSEDDQLKDMCEKSPEYKELLNWGYTIDWRDLSYNPSSFTKIIYYLRIYHDFVEIITPEFKKFASTPQGDEFVTITFKPTEGISFRVMRDHFGFGPYQEYIGKDANIKIVPDYRYDDSILNRRESIISSFTQILSLTEKWHHELESLVNSNGDHHGYILKYDPNGHKQTRIDNEVSSQINTIW